MNWKHVMIVFKKELKDIVRDRKTLFSSIILPIFLMPLLFLLIGGGTEKMSEEMTTDITVALTADSYSPDLPEGEPGNPGCGYQHHRSGG